METERPLSIAVSRDVSIVYQYRDGNRTNIVYCERDAGIEPWDADGAG